jgi:hypothetical protein
MLRKERFQRRSAGVPAQTSHTLEILRCAAEGLPVEIGPLVEPFLRGLINGGYITVEHIGGVFVAGMTELCEVIRPVLTCKGRDLLENLR